jgi:Ribbon-helix-helix protein, copG family
VRTTLTLDEDVAERLKAEARRSGKPFRAVVNECLRFALTRPKVRPRGAPFVVQARDLGTLRPGLSLDNIGELLEAAEGPLHR